MVGVRGFEPPTSASQTLRAKPTALHPVVKQYIKESTSGQQSEGPLRKVLIVLEMTDMFLMWAETNTELLQ